MNLNIYYQFVNFIQGIENGWFAVIWLLIFSVALVLVMRFFKIYNGTQKKFEKVSLMIVALLLFAVLIFLTYLRI